MASSNLARAVPATAPAPERTTSPGAPRPSTRPPRARPATRAARDDRQFSSVVLSFAVAVLLAINVIGASYYMASPAARVRHPYHAWLKPSGIIGQSAGILACVIFVFLWLYPLRKKYKALAFTGSVGRWLDVHVTAALTMPLLLLIHSAWKFDGVIGLGFAAILLVCGSGVVGRYLYTRIPRAKSGVELTLEEVASQRGALVARIAATTGIDAGDVAQVLAQSTEKDAGPRGVIGTLIRLAANDLLRWRRSRELRTRFLRLGPGRTRPSRHAINEAVRLASREIALSQQVRMLEATHRVFRYWHVAHRPVALTALFAVIIHVSVVVALGATWFW